MDWVLALAGFGVGTLVGLTGVGGGSLMTPFLMFYGIPPAVAVGTDLAYAAAAKGLGVWLRHRARAIDWRTAALLMAGSLPASALMIALLDTGSIGGLSFDVLIRQVLAVSLVLTAIIVLVQRRLQDVRSQLPVMRGRGGLTVAGGFVLGALVTLTSVGSGAIGTALLLLLYPRWATSRVVGTDLAYALPLTFVAALGHVYLGNVDVGYLASLVIGAGPGIYLGTRLGLRLPDRHVRAGLGLVLLAVGLSLWLK